MSVQSRRRRDENHAKEQWNRITKFCKNVSISTANSIRVIKIDLY
jgi:hypothetical protein